MYKSCPLECKILKGIWKNAYANDNVFCTTLYIFNFSDPYLFLRIFIFKSLSFPQSLYFLLYIISVRGDGHTCQKSRDPGSRIPGSGRRPLQRPCKVAAADNSHRSCQRTLQRPRSGRCVAKEYLKMVKFLIFSN